MAALALLQPSLEPTWRALCPHPQSQPCISSHSVLSHQPQTVPMAPTTLYSRLSVIQGAIQAGYLVPKNTEGIWGLSAV